MGFVTRNNELLGRAVLFSIECLCILFINMENYKKKNENVNKLCVLDRSNQLKVYTRTQSQVIEPKYHLCIYIDERNAVSLQDEVIQSLYEQISSVVNINMIAMARTSEHYMHRLVDVPGNILKTTTTTTTQNKTKQDKTM